MQTDSHGRYWRGDGTRRGTGNGSGRTASLIREWTEQELVDQAQHHFLVQIEGIPDGRYRREGMLTVRLGQREFRRDLLELYGGACWISGCTVERTLQAAHIEPHSGSNNRLSNGMLLRADLHNLFDAALLWIEPLGDGYRVRLSPSLGGQYEKYRDLHLPPPGHDRASWPDRDELNRQRPPWA